VGAVHAVEVSDTQHSGAEVSRNVFEFAKDLHGPTVRVGVGALTCPAEPQLGKVDVGELL